MLLLISDDTLKAFRNARDNETTMDTPDADTYLTGSRGEHELYVYWAPAAFGSRKVILRKVDSDSYAPLDGAAFEIHKGSPSGPLVSGGNDAEDNPVTTFRSGAGGVFYIGILDYGTYYIKETVTPEGYTQPGDEYYFSVTVDENGVGYKTIEGESTKYSQSVAAANV